MIGTQGTRFGHDIYHFLSPSERGKTTQVGEDPFEAGLSTFLWFLCRQDKSGLGENSRAQIGVLLGSLVQTITEYSENSFVKNYSNEETIREMPKGLFEKLPLLLGLMMTLARSILSSECLEDECNIKEKIWSTVQKHCINCLHKTLVDSNMQVQMAGLHALKIIVQLAIAESPKNENYKLALIFMGELVTDVFSLIWNSTQKPVSNESVAVVGECLKLFVFLHSMIQANEPQQDVLDFLLQAIIMSASVDTEDNSQAGSGLRSIAMKLVSHIANVPSFAAQFRVVLLGMPVDLRQKLQDIIRASVAQDSNSSLATSLPVPLPAPKFVVRSLAANVEFSSQSDSFIPTPLESCDDNLETEEDDDWDNFQSFPASNLAISEETNGCETDKEDGSKQGNDFHVEKWDDFQSFSGSKLMTGSIEQEGTVEDRQLNSPSGVSEGLTDMEQEPTLQKDDLQKDSSQKPSEADYRDGDSDAAANAQGEFDSYDATKNKEYF